MDSTFAATSAVLGPAQKQAGAAPDNQGPHRYQRLLTGCSAFIGSVGCISLLGWLLDLRVLASLGSGLIPVAPSTAVLFILYGASLLLSGQGASSGWKHRTVLLINSVGAAIAAVLFTASLLGIQLEAEHLGIEIVNKPGELPLGHMSPITAFCFLLSSLSSLFSLPSVRERAWVANLAWGIACCVIAAGFLLVLAYLYGTPLLYNSSFIPPAVLTSMAFMALGIGLLVLASPYSWFSRPNIESSTRASYLMLLVFVLLATGIVIAGFLYYRNHEQDYRAEVARQLSAIADLKVDGIVNWRRERLGDASLFYENHNFSGLVRGYLQRTEDGEAKARLRAWLRHVRDGYKYDRVFLLDALGRERMSEPDDKRLVSRHAIRSAVEAMRTRQLIFEDFYRNEYDDRVYLAILVPILDAQGPGRALGSLVLRIDPEQYLYPFLNRWPTPSETAETLLVRRDGSDALFLNALRFKKDAALNLRSSLDQKRMSAVQAILGRHGIMEGIDYRGVPVIADTRPVPGTSWMLISRMDLAETFAPMREKLWTMVALVGALLLGAGAVSGLVWRQQLAQFYQAQYETTCALQEGEVNLKEAQTMAQLGNWKWDVKTGNVEWSEEVYKIFRLDPKTFTPQIDSILALSPWPEEHARDKELIQKAMASHEKGEYEQRFLRPDGSTGYYYSTFRGKYDDSGELIAIVGTVQDITERKLLELKLGSLIADLQRSNKELEQFAYVASHDLQEPLRMVASYTQLLADRYEKQLDDKARLFIHYAVDGARRMQLLINDLLAYSRVGTKGRPMAQVDMHASLGEAIKNLKMNIHETQAIVTNDELPELRADGTQMVQLFQNLISNSLKFHGEQLPRVHISAKDEGTAWLFSVKDNGIGIEPQYADKVFVIFQRLHTKEEYSGSGIGLAICKKIVERHGGRIWFESEPGNGTTFYFTIPK